MNKFFTLFVSALCAVGAWAEEPTQDDVKYVQLYDGGPMWTTKNLGAVSAVDAGLYFWWGDVQGHTEGDGFEFYYTNEAVLSSNNDEGFVVDGKLVAAKDAATQQLGAGYRMPTMADFQDLADKCTWEWKQNYNGLEGVNGCLVTGKGAYAGNSIFLPSAGCILNSNLEYNGFVCEYWSSSASAEGTAYYLFSNWNVFPDYTTGRHYGFSIRPVFDAQAAYDYLVSLIGEEEYAFWDAKIFVNEEGVLQIDDEELESDELVVDGSEFMFGHLKFVVEDGAIAHVYAMDYEDEDKILYEYGVLVPESELVALVGDNVYVGGGQKIAVAEGQLTIDGEPLALMLGSTYLSKTGDNYVYGLESGSFVFVVEDNEVARIEAIFGDELFGTYEKQNPIAQIGETTYTDAHDFRKDFYDIDEKATVKLLGDIVLQDFDIKNENEGADITIDLNGHSITGNNDDGAIIVISEGALTITGEGTIENTAEYGFAIASLGTLTVNGGTYKTVMAVCGVANGAELIINGGKFDAEALYFTSPKHTRPIVKGGLFSMDPSDCVAEGYKVVDNDDEATMAEYPYKVVVDEDATYNYIISLIGDKTYVNAGLSVFVFDENEIVISVMGDVLGGYLHNVSVNGNEYLLECPNFADLKVVVENGEIAHLYLWLDEYNTLELVEGTGADGSELEAQLVALMGDNVYVGGYGSIFVDEGCVMLDWGELFDGVLPMNMFGELAYLDGFCMCQLMNGMTLLFVPDEDGIAAISVIYDEEVLTVFEKSSTPTSIAPAGADKLQKTIKTIENGRVVIIRGSDKYDLSGRKL